MADDEHDHLCPFNRVQQQGCKCPWIIRAREDERGRIAQAIDDAPVDISTDPWSMGYSKGLLDAARIARGSNE